MDAKEKEKIDPSSINVVDYIKIIDKDTRAVLVNKRDHIKQQVEKNEKPIR